MIRNKLFRFFLLAKFENFFLFRVNQGNTDEASDESSDESATVVVVEDHSKMVKSSKDTRRGRPGHAFSAKGQSFRILMVRKYIIIIKNTCCWCCV
jgi:hypothetical protein